MAAILFGVGVFREVGVAHGVEIYVGAVALVLLIGYLVWRIHFRNGS